MQQIISLSRIKSVTIFKSQRFTSMIQTGEEIERAIFEKVYKNIEIVTNIFTCTEPS